jgi:hypothetical protein
MYRLSGLSGFSYPYYSEQHRNQRVFLYKKIYVILYTKGMKKSYTGRFISLTGQSQSFPEDGRGVSIHKIIETADCGFFSARHT